MFAFMYPPLQERWGKSGLFPKANTACCVCMAMAGSQGQAILMWGSPFLGP
jgi:hypothetical protein